MKLAALLSVSLASLVQQSSVKNWADTLDVKYKVLDNFVKSSNISFPWAKSDAFDFSITLRNTGSETISNDIPWAIYFYQDQVIFNEENANINTAVDIGQGLSVQHVNGYLWKLVKNLDASKSSWSGLKTGEEKTWMMQGNEWIVADSTLFPNWYFACEDNSCNPAIIKSTESVQWNKPDYVHAFLEDKQRYRYENDQAYTITPESQFLNNDGLKIKNDNGGDITKPYYSLPVLPLPSFVEMKPNNLQYIDGVPQPSAGIKINLDYWNIKYKEDLNYLNIPCNDVETPCDCDVPGQGNDPNEQCKCPFLLDHQQPGGECPPGGCPSLLIVVGTNVKDLAWRASMDTAAATLYIKDCSSIKGATDFFSKLVKKLNTKGEYFDSQAMLFKGDFGDKPKPNMETRAVFLDHSRNFHGLEPVKKLLKHMSMLNLNQLHMRMSDDEGWRIQVTGIEELTSIGGRRCHDTKGDQCIMPQLGSGPMPDTGVGSGHFTREQYREILEIATEHGIRIVPEIVAPGHNAAAIQAMKWYETNKGDESYRLTDPNQEAGGFSVQGFYDNVMNPCMDSTFVFLQKIVDQFKEDHASFKDIQNHFHIGGDETNIDLIKGSPICRDKMKDEGLDHNNDDDVNAYFHMFFQKYVKMVGEAGFHVHGWEEVWEYEENPGIFKIYNLNEWDVPTGTDLYAYHWNNMWLHGDGPTTGHMMANAGYKLIMSPATHLYLDHAQYEHPNSRGLMWATRSSNLTKVFSFRPFDFYRNGLTYIDGSKIDNGCKPGKTDEGHSWDCYPLTEEGRKNVVGMEACLWSEEIIEEKHIWEQLFPRVFAVAQRSWAETSWEETTGSSWDIFSNSTFKADWLRFRYALQFKLRELEKDKMWYDLPKPGALQRKPGDINSWTYNTLYYHNPIMFRNPNSTDKTWKGFSAVKDEVKNNDADNRRVEMVTTSFKKYSSGQPLETSQPYEFTMEDGDGSSQSTILMSSVLLALVFSLY